MSVDELKDATENGIIILHGGNADEKSTTNGNRQ